MKNMKKIQLAVLSLLAISSITVAAAAPSYALDIWGGCTDQKSDAVCKAQGDNVTPIFQNILSLLLYLIGAIAVIMIVIGGIKYVTSNGDSNAIQSAKNTIFYSVIGLVVAILGQAIILFVVKWLK